jgi:hypothetical protein
MSDTRRPETFLCPVCQTEIGSFKLDAALTMLRRCAEEARDNERWWYAESEVRVAKARANAALAAEIEEMLG